MALSKEQAQQLRDQLKQVKPGRAGRYLYCAAGADGDPVLLVHRRIIPRGEAQKLRRTAQRKLFSRGTVECSDDRTHYLFRTDEPVDRMERHLRTFFGAAVPKLKRSRILSAEALADDPTQPAETLEAALEALYQTQRETERLIQQQEDVLVACEARVEEVQSALLVRSSTRQEAAAARDEAADALALLRRELERQQEEIGRAESALERAMVREAGPSAPAGSIREAEDAALAAERAAGTAEQVVADLERRQAELAGRLRSKELARRREGSEQADAEESALHDEQAEIQGLLAEARRAARVAIRDHLLANSRAATALEQWSAEQQAWWAGPAPDDETLAELRRAEQRLKRAVDHQATRDAAAAALEAQVADIDAAVARAETERASLAAEQASLAALSEQLVVALEGAELLEDTSGLEARLAEVEARLEAVAAEQATAAQAATLEDERWPLLEQLVAAQAAQAAAREAADACRIERNALLLHDSEQTRSDGLREAARDSERAVAEAKARLEEARADEAVGDAQLAALTDARRAVADAHAALSVADLEAEQLRQTASKLRGLRGKDGRAEIDEARGRLPEAELAQRAARQAYEDALAQLAQVEQAHEQVGAALQEQIALAEATADEEAALAEAEQIAAQAQLRVAEDDARVAALAADVQAQRVAALLDAFSAQQSPARQKALQMAVAREERAQDAASDAASALFDAEMRLEQHQALLQELADDGRGAAGDDPAHMAKVQDALEALGALQETARACRAAAEETLSAADAAAEGVAKHRAQLLETAVRVGDPAGVALKDAQAAHEAALRDAADAAARDAAAQERLTMASVAAADAARARAVARGAHEAEALIVENLDVIDAIHQLRDPQTGESRTYDLEDPEQRNAAAKALSPEVLAQVDAFRAALARKAAQMIGDGATAEELQATFRSVPNGLRPAAYRTEVAAFEMMEAAFTEEHESTRDAALIEAAELRRDPVAQARSVSDAMEALGLSADAFRDQIVSPLLEEVPDRLEQGRLGAELLQSAVGVGETLALLPDDLAGPLSTMMGAAAALAGGIAAGRDIREGLEASQEVDPVSRKLRQDVLLDSVSELTSAGAALGGLLLPALGTAETARQLAMDLLEAGARKLKSRYDGILSEAARVAGSPLAGAFTESLAREEALCAKYRIQVAAGAGEIAAALVGMLPGAGAAVGVALELSASGARWSAERALGAKELAQARLARRLLADARRGDNAARTELFKHHPRYAKGLIAHMAFNEGDPFALMYTRERGLADGDIAASSEAIIRRYLLEAAEQPLDLPAADAQHGRLRTIVEALRRPKAVDVIDPAQLAQLQEGAALAAQLIDNRVRGQRLLDDPETDEQTRAALGRLLAAEEQTLSELRQLAAEALKTISDQPAPDDDAARRRALAEARDAALSLVSQLARAL